MIRPLMLLLLVPSLITLSGCGDRDAPEMDFGGEDLGPDRFAVQSREGDAKMGLTDRYVYFGLSDQVLEKARSEMREDSDTAREKGFFGGLLEKGVEKALGFRAKLPVEEIRDIRWEDGSMRIEFMDPERTLGKGFSVNDQPVTEAFVEEDVRAFSEAFRRLKSEGTAGS